MAGIVDEYLETPMENDDVFPCKGCGEVRFPIMGLYAHEVPSTILTALNYSDPRGRKSIRAWYVYTFAYLLSSVVPTIAYHAMQHLCISAGT